VQYVTTITRRRFWASRRLLFAAIDLLLRAKLALDVTEDEVGSRQACFPLYERPAAG
jgi:hypothetical protein